MQNQAPGFTARQVLGYCEHGAQKMRGNLMGADWVLVWAGTIALLRAVGHALANVDGAAHPALAIAQKIWWENLKTTKPDPPIYWEFIERDRNLLLKEAFLRAGQGVTVTPGTGILLFAGRKPPPIPPSPPSSVVFSYHMNAGHFAGRDPRDLVDEAIAWWNQELSTLGL